MPCGWNVRKRIGTAATRVHAEVRDSSRTRSATVLRSSAASPARERHAEGREGPEGSGLELTYRDHRVMTVWSRYVNSRPDPSIPSSRRR